MKTFSVLTLGCKANQYDGEAISNALESAGLVQVEPGVPADVCVVNTCSVTNVADGKSRRYVKRAVRANPGARIVVTGCGANSQPGQLAAISGVGHVVPNEAKGRLLELLGLADGPVDLKISRFGGHTRAFLKVQDGCDCFCTYCIVPHVRGRVVSRPLAEIEAEARRLVAAGHKEIVVTGIHLGSYGQDLDPRRGIDEVLDTLIPIDGLRRIRLSSIEARDFSERLLDQIARYPKVCPHFHIPLQSGSDRILGLMGRRYRSADILGIVERLNRVLTDVSYTTDVIVGFSGETDEDFEQTVAICRKVGFSKVHIFPYSDREGTPAAKMPGKIARETMAERLRRLAAVEKDLALAYKQRFVGREVEVLTERQRDPETGSLTGYTDRYIRVLFAGPDDWKNEFVRVRIARVGPEVAYGESSL
jgi:threonylcarbamoyladenosine tRNA methylthiotransferase MtaB